ncbi:hypothetical protein H4R34_003597 [Dimargaris verticillata]|uniref:MSP domain-containing protein n=1 Tax=Dimargaris verticillata TaxID=2761393 RepID=A0A9W8B5X6_9FUNG|nr:hypothetical protein H4R34_003597 [Dimargaris verticillata]
MASSGPLIRISPSEFHFTASKETPGGYVGRLVVKNLRPSPVGFKFKTNAPEKFSVKPVLGSLERLGESVEIVVRSLSKVKPEDKFLIQTIQLTREESAGLNATKRIREGFINCRMASAGSSPTSPLLRQSHHYAAAPTSTAPKRRSQNAQQTFSWKSIFEVPLMMVQLLICLIYFTIQRIVNVSHFFTAKVWRRKDVFWFCLCCLIVISTIPLKKYLKTYLLHSNGGPIAPPDTTTQVVV